MKSGQRVQTPTEAVSTVDDAYGSTASIERRSIEFVPLSERHGTAKSLFTLWFGGNMQVTAVAAGAISVAIGVPLPWAILATVIGHLFGAVFMALHSAQGPKLGIPQMIQSRAQFGFYGAVVPIVLVVLMYLGYFASSAVLGGNALASLTGLPIDVSIAVCSVIVCLLALFGYRLVHLAERWISLASFIAFGILTTVLLAQHHNAAAWTSGTFQIGPFLLAVAIAATWQLTYAPYVADYSRYLPPTTSIRSAFWYTYAGTVIASVWMFVFGAIATAVAAKAFNGGSVDFIADLGGGFSWFFFLVIIAGIIGANSLNLYGLSMSSSTTLNSLFRVRISFRTRIVIILASAVVGTGLAIVGRTNFIGNFSDFILFLAYFLIPWTSINLADFYLVRKEKYNLKAIYDPRGEYGGVDWRAMTAYLVGVLIQLPFVNSAPFYTGFLVHALGGADISWIISIPVSGGIYVALMRAFPTRAKYPAGPAATAEQKPRVR